MTTPNRNSSDAVALAQTIEGGLDEITNMLQSVRTLAVQASNGTNTQDDRNSLNQQANAYAAEINRIAKQTKFAGKTVLNGYDKAAAAGGGGEPGKAATATINSIYDKSGGADMSGSIKFQVGANSGDAISLTVKAFTMSKIASSAGIKTVDEKGSNGLAKPKAADAALLGAIQFALSSASTASALIKTIDSMINTVDTQRGNLGAIQNRLESTIRNQSNVAANQTDARSRIRDADFAQESANLSQQSIIQQAASSMLTQANTRPQLALSLLR